MTILPPAVGAQITEMGRLEPPPEWYGPLSGLILDQSSNEVLQPDGKKPIRNFIGVPRHLPAGTIAPSANAVTGLTPWEVELYHKTHSKIGYADIWARQPTETPQLTLSQRNTANSNRLRHARKPYNALCWATKCAGIPKE